MIEVFFEDGTTAIKVATFIEEETYIACSEALLEKAKELGWDKVTEREVPCETSLPEESKRVKDIRFSLELSLREAAPFDLTAALKEEFGGLWETYVYQLPEIPSDSVWDEILRPSVLGGINSKGEVICYDIRDEWYLETFTQNINSLPLETMLHTLLLLRK